MKCTCYVRSIKMTIDSGDLLNSILASLDRIEYIRPDDIPNIDLYMDQVTTFMDDRLKSSARYPGRDKILTKTMINNYAKNDLLPPPIKKKYSKEHVLLLIFIYYFKGFMSISDIQTLLNPITEAFFQKQKGFNMEDLYREAFTLERDQLDTLKADVAEKYKKAQNAYSNAPKEDKEFLERFAFICLLSYDVYVKKLIIEKMVDELAKTKSVKKEGTKNSDKQNE